MEISRLELVLDIAEEAKLHTHSYNVSKTLGEELSDEEYQPIIVRDEKNKFGIRWDYETCGIITENVENENDCINKFISTLESINKVAPFGKFSTRKLRVDWIFPVNEKYDFKTLELKYRHIFIKDNEIFKKCYDSSVVMDMSYEHIKLHHQSGTMDISQLQNMFKVFTIKKGHPTLFLFLNTEASESRIINYSVDNMKEFILYSFNLCKNQAEEFGKMMEAVL